MDKTVGVVASIGGGAAGADNGDGAFGIEVGRTEDIEQGGTVVSLVVVKSLGIVGVGEEKGADMVLLTEAQFFLSTVKSTLIENIVEDRFVCAESILEFGFGQGEDVLVRIEVDEATDGSVAESGGEGEGYL